MADPSDLNPSTKPSGPPQKRLSNVPKAMLLGIGVLMAGAVSYTFYEKMYPSQNSHAAKSDQKTKPAMEVAMNMTSEFMDRREMPPKNSTPPPPPKTPDPVPEKQERKAVSPEMQQLQAQRLRNLEEALHSKTSVRFESVPQASQNPQDTYEKKVAQLSAGLPEGRTVDANDISQFDRSNRWSLNTKPESPLPGMLRAGSVIPAIMISGINSDLPGQVIAQVSQNVYDTATGTRLLIPQGTKIVGTYSSNVAYGQSRILMAWQRLTFPDGKTMDIGAMPGADQAGYAGFNDKTNNHYLRIFGSAILLSGVVAAVDLSQNTSSSDSSDRTRASDSLSEALGQSLGQVMTQMLQKNMNISPTLEIRPGYRFNIMVTKDIRLSDA